MVFGYFRFKFDACLPVRGRVPCLVHRISRAAWLLGSGLVVCTALAACGGHDDDDRAVSSTANQDESPSAVSSDALSPPQLDSSTTVANVAPAASGALAPPVMHYAQ
jgi:hypothetical protein